MHPGHGDWPATELRLEQSSFTGNDVVIRENRKFLKNALGFGIVRLGFDPKDTTPIIGYGDKKTFVAMPLEGDEPKVDPGKLTVLSSNTIAVTPSKIDKLIKAGKPDSTARSCRNVKPLQVEEGLAVSWFDQPGMGPQYKLPKKIKLLDDYLKDITPE